MRKSAHDFDSIRVSLASPELIRRWSYGEVTRPDTINYRTLRPEKDGLFCERIFGPSKDWECQCGKYKKARYDGVTCDRCGVEVTRSSTRRERMGHIDLAAPAAHIWFAKGAPGRLALMLNSTPKNVDRLLGYSRYAVIRIDESERARAINALHNHIDRLASQLADSPLTESIQKAMDIHREKWLPARRTLYSEDHLSPLPSGDSWRSIGRRHDKALADMVKALKDGVKSLAKESAARKFAEDIAASIEEINFLEALNLGDLLTESRLRRLDSYHERVFDARMGAEAALELLKRGDLSARHNYESCAARQEACACERQADGLCPRHCRHRRDLCELPCHERGGFCHSERCLRDEIAETSGAKQAKAYKRLRIADAFRKSGNKPEWMIMTALPVLPPELRPMIQLDGGRFATSDLNDLYIRVINRNNRLKRLSGLNAPDVIVRNEKRMLQEAVNALLDNARVANPVSGRNGNKLKSLSDLLRGKQGRFRQNLLGKRVDYSGRSVIVVGPELKFHECGLPRKMALELYKPFVMNKLVQRGHAVNAKGAKRAADSESPLVWAILEEVIKDKPILLNRAPTLHRLGIQAFQPVLVEGSAIRVHPLVTPSFNADFDGDQMAVHLPLGVEAVAEARATMMSVSNMIAPSSGEAIVAPTLDIVLGCYYLTQALQGAPGTGARCADIDDVLMSYDQGAIHLRAPVWTRDNRGEWMETTAGRAIFNQALNGELPFINQVIDKKALKNITAQARQALGGERAAKIMDNIKDIGFLYAALSGLTIGIHDIEIPPEKPRILRKAEEDARQVAEMFNAGMMNEETRYAEIVRVWNEAGDELTSGVENNLRRYGGALKDEKTENAGIGLFIMAISGAKGNISQIKQMAGMRGLMADPKGRVIERPIKSNFREGLSVQEYFISTHGARKGLTDTALKTAESGYMTRRLVDVAQELIITIDDCETQDGMWMDNAERPGGLPGFAERASGRYPAAPIIHPETGETLAGRDTPITLDLAERIAASGVKGASFRAAPSCQAKRGLCRKCYGLSLATWEPAFIGEAVGVIAAQSIGEPGTQLTMRTFHTGGIAGSDITSGLPRVQELFEAQSPKGEAILSEIDGAIHVNETEDGRFVSVASAREYADEHLADPALHALAPEIKPGAEVSFAQPLALSRADAPDVLSRATGRIKSIRAREDGLIAINIAYEESERREYDIPAASRIIVSDGDEVAAGDPITAGAKNPKHILALEGEEAARRYIIDEVQAVYRSQGVDIHDKHIEVIATQMFRKLEITDPGDADSLPGDLIDKNAFAALVKESQENGTIPPKAEAVLLSITDAALKTESFLSAASFQETTRILTDAAIAADRDYLRGLKENVIIGRLIPARIDRTNEGREYLGYDIPEPEKPNPFLASPAD